MPTSQPFSPRNPGIPDPAVVRLARRREDLALSQKTVAVRAEISPAYLSQVECGRAQPSVHVVRRIAGALSWSMRELYADDPA